MYRYLQCGISAYHKWSVGLSDHRSAADDSGPEMAGGETKAGEPADVPVRKLPIYRGGLSTVAALVHWGMGRLKRE